MTDEFETEPVAGNGVICLDALKWSDAPNLEFQPCIQKNETT
jgi:hypothetical protein